MNASNVAPRPLALLLLALALLLPRPAAAAQAAPSDGAAGVHRFALIIGANDGGPGRVPLQYATTDAQAFASVLSELGGVRDEDLVLLLDPSRVELDRGLAEMSTRVQAAHGAHHRTEVVLYYSGHSDEQGLRMGTELVPYPELKDALFDIPADVRMAILDSCASGVLTRLKGGSFQAPFLVDDATRVKGYAILTSSSADEAAQESDRIGASFFTHALISGLRGAADTTGDSRVTLNEAYQFAFNETLAHTERTQGGPQHPAYDIQLAGTGDLVLTDLRDTSAVLVLTPELAGRIYVRDGTGRLVVEIRKPAGAPVELALEPGEYTVTVQGDTTLVQSDVSLTDGDRERLGPGDLSPVSPEQTASRGDVTITIDVAPTAPEEAAPHPPTPEKPPCPDAAVMRLGLITTAPALDGVMVGLISNHVRCDARGLMISPVLNTVGRDTDGLLVTAGANVGLGQVTGASVAAGFNVAQDLRGIQGAGGFNISGGSGGRAQLAGGFNVSGGGGAHLQAAGGFNISGGGELRGVQGTGGFNVARGAVKGVQGAGGFNVAGGAVDGAQVSGGFNVAGGAVMGFQAAGGFNRAAEVQGLQLGVINISGRVDGAQIGVINIATDVEGLQLGVVNIARDVKGAPIGVLNIIKEGEHHVGVWIDDLGHVNTGVILGGRNIYSVFAAGMQLDSSIDRFTFGSGIGVHVPLDDRFWLRFEAMSSQVVDPDLSMGELNLWVVGRAEVGVRIVGRLTAFVGPAANTFISTQGGLPGFTDTPESLHVHGGEKGSVSLDGWPGFVFGIEI